MENPRRIHWAWVILATGFLDLFINYSVRLGYGVVLPEMIKALSLSRTAGGSVFNAYLFSYIVLTPLTGYLTDRLGARKVISTCALVLGAGVLLMGTVHTLWTACVFYAIAGLGATGMWTPVITVVQRWFAPDRRGLALGILSTGYGLGFATMGVVFPWIVAHLNWRYAWYFLGLAAFIMAAVNAVFLRKDPGSEGLLPWGSNREPGALPLTPKSKRPLEQVRPPSHVLRQGSFWLIGFSYFSIAFSLYGITTFMVDYAESQLGLPIARAGLLATIHGLFQVVGVLTILPLSDRWGRKPTILMSNAAIAACLIGILFIQDSWIMLFFLVGWLAVFYGATFPIYGACAGDYFPKEVMGTVIGAWTPFYGSGAILVHWISGALRDASGSYNAPFVINACMAVVGLLLMAWVREAPRNSA